MSFDAQYRVTMQREMPTPPAGRDFRNLPNWANDYIFRLERMLSALLEEPEECDPLTARFYFTGRIYDHTRALPPDSEVHVNTSPGSERRRDITLRPWSIPMPDGQKLFGARVASEGMTRLAVWPEASNVALLVAQPF